MTVRVLVVAPGGEASPLATTSGFAALREAADATLTDPLTDQVDLSTVDAVVVAPWGTHGLERHSPKCWSDAARLRVLAGTFDNRVELMLGVSLRELAGRDIVVIDTSRSMTPSVAEFALAMVLNLLRDIPAHVELVRSGGWITEPVPPWYGPADLADRRVGLAGYGTLNRSLRRLLTGFGCAVAAYDPHVPGDVFDADGVSRTPGLAELAAMSDVFVVGIPPTPSTIRVVNAAVIDALPVGALFVLPTRMAVVDQRSLWRRCAAGELRAAVDVFEPEPPPADASFRRDRNVLPTPHIAGNTYEFHQRCFTTACLDTLAVLQGRAPQYAMSVVDADIYAGRPT
jgi:phosphoglycerate dehydrogenase-like enzyme